MGTRVFVGGLSWSTTDLELRQAFAVCGTVLDAKVVTDRETGRSRGFGFVTFENAQSAARAIEELGGTTLDRRTIRVDDADVRPRNELRPRNRR
jgi:RNA recognition motif-containing protein